MGFPPSNPPPQLPGRSAGLGEYIKRAFFQRWNLLAFIGAAGASLLSPWPDAILPLVLAGEAAFVGLLVGHPKFRAAVDAQTYQETKAPQALAANQTLVQMVGQLSQPARQRFERLRARCLEMRQIADGVRGGRPGMELGTSGIDKLLWVFLRLQVSQDALERFLARTDIDEIQAKLKDSQQKLETAKAAEQRDERVVRSLEDNVATQQQRFDNYGRAKQNAAYVDLELDRIETKIQAITESSVNQQNPDLLSSQIEGVAESMQSTEKAIQELNELTGIVDQMQEPPAILEADWRRVSQ